MSDGAISQDEIDALLSGVSVDGLNSSGHVGNTPNYNFDIPTLKNLAVDLKPKLQEKINAYSGASFTVDTPVVEEIDRDRLLSKLPEVLIAINADYTEGVKGSHLYLVSNEFALKLNQLMTHEDSVQVDDMILGMVSEAIATHISAQIDAIEAGGKVKGLSYAPPQAVNESKAMIMFPAGKFVLTSYPLTLDGSAYTIWECLAGDVAEAISKALGADTEEALTPIDLGMGDTSMNGMGGMQQQPMMNGMNGMNGMQMQQPMMGNMNSMNGMGGMQMQQPMMNSMNMNAMAGMGGMNNMNKGMNMGMNVPNIQQVQYPSFQQNPNIGEQGNISLIMDVTMEMTVELGRCKKSIKEILGMGEGTIIELEKLAGEPVDILVNHKPIAKGEVVVIDENFGVRVTEVLSPMERVSDLN